MLSDGQHYVNNIKFLHAWHNISHHFAHLVSKKHQLCPIAPNFFWWILGSQKALRVIGFAQKCSISYRLGVMAKKPSILCKNNKNG